VIKAIVICGRDAVKRYDETGTIPSDKWFDSHGGIADVKKFKTQSEYEVHSMGLNDVNSWEETALIDKEFTKSNDTSTDYKFCKKWRCLFSDREHDVYCQL